MIKAEDEESIRAYMAAHALGNANICTGTAKDWDLTRWFGKERTGIRPSEIAAAQAVEYADELFARLKARPRS